MVILFHHIETPHKKPNAEMNFASTASPIIANQPFVSLFQISDVMVDKSDVALSLNIKIPQSWTEQDAKEGVSCVSTEPSIVSKSIVDEIVHKVVQLLERQGVPGAQCPHCFSKLYPLSDDGKGEYRVLPKEPPLKLRLEIFCGSDEPRYVFNLSTSIMPKDVKRDD